jgi:ribosomal protein S18 acetylase RimI-like enzyme
MTVDVRLATPADADSVAALVDAAYRDYIPRIGRRPAPMDADYSALIERGQLWVAVDDGYLLGILVLVPKPDHLLLENIAVAPEAQGNGLGWLLLDVADEQASEQGLPEIRLYTNAAMTENLAFYPRCGYVETGRAEQDGFSRVFFSKPV